MRCVCWRPKTYNINKIRQREQPVLSLPNVLHIYLNFCMSAEERKLYFNLKASTLSHQKPYRNKQKHQKPTKKNKNPFFSKKLLPLKCILKIFWFCFWWFSPCWHTFGKGQFVECLSVQLKRWDGQLDFRHVGLPYLHLLNLRKRGGWNEKKVLWWRLGA